MASEPTATEQELRRRIDTVEKSYEYFLAYAAQGLRRENAAGKDGEVRRHLEAAIAALDGLTPVFRLAVEAQPAPKQGDFGDFLDTLNQDVNATSAALRMALGRAAISSQLIDNLNGSVHVRALLTDLFLLDEALEVPAGSE